MRSVVVASFTLACLASGSCGGGDVAVGNETPSDGEPSGGPEAGGGGGTAGRDGGAGGMGQGVGGASGGSSSSSGGGGGSGGTETAFPMPDWPTATPDEVGLDKAQLDKARDYSKSIGGFCLVVIRDGKLVYEDYYNGATVDSRQKTWSIAKSFTSALVGLMLQRGEIASVEQPVASILTEWSGTDQESITIRHLLDMVSGHQYGLLSDSLLALAGDMTNDALTQPVQFPPGTNYEYSNKDTQVFEALIKRATGYDAEEYARQFLWQPLGFGANTSWERDRAGSVTMFMNVSATCRDFARLGYLWLNRGVWNGIRMIPESYIEASTHPSSAPNHGHSHYWWLNGVTPFINSTSEPGDDPNVMMFPNAPHDLYSAQGLGQNFIDVIPSTRTIYMHTRPGPLDPPSKLLDDALGTLDALTKDGKQREHRELLDLLLPAG